MTLGAWTLGLAVATAALALAPWKHARLATRAHAALVLAALAWLTADFLAGTLGHSYTWAHTRLGYPWYYRLAGLWGGEEGTVLLWNGVVALALLFVPERRAQIALLSFSGALSLFGLLFGTFAATTADQLARAPAGSGLADILVTPLMVIHPPIQFVGYGLMAVPAAYAIASLWDPAKDGLWAARAFPWARRAWLFATTGLTLGALWAYYVLSFGGYWAWDPVETSNLLPWLALTAFLHAGKQRMRGQGSHTSALVLAYGAFLLTLFATFATRSGLWVSVHAFTDPTDRFEPDAPARLLAILDVHLPTRAFLGLLTGLLLAGPALFAARRLGQPVWGGALLALAGAGTLAPDVVWGALFWLATLATPLAPGMGILLSALVGAPFIAAFLREDAEHGKPKLDVRTLLSASTILLAVALGVVFLLNLQVVNGPDRSLFDARVPFLAIPIVVVLSLMLALAPLGKRNALILAALGVAGSIAAWLAFRSVVALAAPVCLVAGVAAILQLVHVQGRAAPHRRRIEGALLLVASLALLVVASNPPTRVGGIAIPDGASLAMGLAGVALAALGILAAIARFREKALFTRAFWRDERVRIREAGIYLVHLAVALGLLGFAASTYAQEREVYAAVPIGSTQEIAGYELTLAPPSARVEGSELDALTIPVLLAQRGEASGSEELSFEWRPSGLVYRGILDVRRTLTEDVYLSPMAFHTPEGWVGADSAAGSRVAAQSVDAVTFSASVLPLMSLVWFAGWTMVLGMGFVLVGSARSRPP